MTAGYRWPVRPDTVATGQIAFSYQRLAWLGVPEDSLASFSEEFRAGTAARKEVLGDLGTDDPGHWIPPRWAAPMCASG
ncbi:hypothetical protein V7793_03600 [Streptomyces sp. KLMMK]|uniref:hypothetical protein n=1 Tax=Streptomyces sp. KLMMK TaxID=3109353 RepID=UPI002FFE4402